MEKESERRRGGQRGCVLGKRHLVRQRLLWLSVQWRQTPRANRKDSTLLRLRMTKTSVQRRDIVCESVCICLCVCYEDMTVWVCVFKCVCVCVCVFCMCVCVCVCVCVCEVCVCVCECVCVLSRKLCGDV